MSVKIMSAVFETEFFDLKDEAGNVSKASTVKLVLLALADHSNDEGEGAYPGLDRMEKKTALSRQCIINTYDALKFNGIIHLEGKSKLGTNNYTINTQSFPRTFDEGKSRLLVNPVDPQCKPGLPGGVNPVDPNHPLTISKPSSRSVSADWDFLHGKDPELSEADKNAVLYKSIAERLEVGLKRNQFPQSIQAQAVYRWIAKQEEAGQSLDKFIAWATRDERAMTYTYVYHKDPSLIKRDWPQAFPEPSRQEYQPTPLPDDSQAVPIPPELKARAEKAIRNAK